MIITVEDQTKALENILMELQLSASRVSDADFKRMGAKNLMTAIQDAKKLLDMSKNLSIYEEINQHLEMHEGYSDSLGLHNTV